MAGESQRRNKIWKGPEATESGAEMERKESRPKEHQERPTLTKEDTSVSLQSGGDREWGDLPPR